MHERTCPECGAAFMPRNGGQVCCSDKCRAARKKRQDHECRRRLRAARDNEAKKLAALDLSIRAQLAQERHERRIRRRRADLAYKSLHVPVSRHVENGVSVEWRGQPRLGGCAVNHVMVSVK